MFTVIMAESAEADMRRVADYLFDHAETVEALDSAVARMEYLRSVIKDTLSRTPFTCRKAEGHRSTRRELVVPAGSSGYVALFEISGPNSVVVIAVRHQLEEDFH